MFLKNLNLFKIVNIFMLLFCVCSLFFNYSGVNVLNANKAISSIDGNNFEYLTSDNSLIFKKNGNFIGKVSTNKKLSIRNDNIFFYNNAIIVAGKITAAVAAGGLAAAGPAAIAGLQEVLGGAFATAVATLQLPGEAAVAATLGGAGEAAAAAAAADAAVAAGGIGALMSTFVVPVLIAAGVGAGVM